MKKLLLFLLIASASAAAQKNQISLTGEGNFNPVTYVYIPQNPPIMGSSQKSSLGGAVEYDRWFTPHQAFGVRYEQNPSDGKLITAAQFAGVYTQNRNIWPQMRWECLGLFTQRFEVSPSEGPKIRPSRITPFIQEGAGAVITDDKTNWAMAGWSHSLAFAAGSGSDYWITNNLSVRVNALMIADQTGCYDDPACRPTWGISHDFGAGFSYMW